MTTAEEVFEAVKMINKGGQLMTPLNALGVTAQFSLFVLNQYMETIKTLVFGI